jgi:hypothetical protein
MTLLAWIRVVLAIDGVRLAQNALRVKPPPLTGM